MNNLWRELAFDVVGPFILPDSGISALINTKENLPAFCEFKYNVYPDQSFHKNELGHYKSKRIQVKSVHLIAHGWNYIILV